MPSAQSRRTSSASATTRGRVTGPRKSEEWSGPKLGRKSAGSMRKTRSSVLFSGRFKKGIPTFAKSQPVPGRLFLDCVSKYALNQSPTGLANPRKMKLRSAILGISRAKCTAKAPCPFLAPPRGLRGQVFVLGVVLWRKSEKPPTSTARTRRLTVFPFYAVSRSLLRPAPSQGSLVLRPEDNKLAVRLVVKKVPPCTETLLSFIKCRLCGSLQVPATGLKRWIELSDES